jgi:hypothetical protein
MQQTWTSRLPCLVQQTVSRCHQAALPRAADLEFIYTLMYNRLPCLVQQTGVDIPNVFTDRINISLCCP